MAKAKRKAMPKQLTDLVGCGGLLMQPDGEMWEHAFVLVLQLNAETFVAQIVTNPVCGELRILTLAELTTHCRLYADEEVIAAEMARMTAARTARETPPA